jgi:RNA polymerase sigma-70 factor (ECF subfamily)
MLWLMGMLGAGSPVGQGESAPPAVQADPSDDEDRVWVLKFQNGGEEGFNRLVLKHKDRIYSLCARMLGDPDEADDTAQETFVRVYHGLKGFRMESKFSTWAWRIAVNACKNKLDSKAWKERRVKADLEAADWEGAESSPSPAQELEAKGRRASIEAAIARLPEDQRVLVVLRDVEGRSYEEIAENLSLNPGTLKSRLNRARAQLQEWLKDLR